MSVIQGAGSVKGDHALGTGEADGHGASLAVLQRLALLHEGRGAGLGAAQLHTARCLPFSWGSRKAARSDSSEVTKTKTALCVYL